MTKFSLCSAYGKTNKDLIRDLRVKKIIQSYNVEKAMLRTDIGCYTKVVSYADISQYIGYGITMRPPHIYAYILECLKKHLVPGESALNVGCGSGYLTACMALMVGRKGKAIGIDHIPGIIKLAKLNVRKDNPTLLRNKRIQLIVGDGRMGSAEDGPFNAIYVGAVVDEIPEPLLFQLKRGGRLIVPMGLNKGLKYFMQVDKKMNGFITKQKLMGFTYLPERENKCLWPCM